MFPIEYGDDALEGITYTFWIGPKDILRSNSGIRVRLKNFLNELCPSAYNRGIVCISEGRIKADMIIEHDGEEKTLSLDTWEINHGKNRPFPVLFSDLRQDYELMGYRPGATREKAQFQIKVTTIELAKEDRDISSQKSMMMRPENGRSQDAVMNKYQNIDGKFNKLFCKTSPAQEKLTATIMMEFSRHVDYTRQVILTKYYTRYQSKTPLSVTDTVARLLKNQSDIGKTFGYYTTVSLGDRLTKLLKEHIKIAATIIDNVYNVRNYEKEIEQWEENGRSIADFIVTTFSLKPKKKIKMLNSTFEEAFLLHLTQTTRELLAQSEGKFQESIRHYDEAQNHMAKIASYLVVLLGKKIKPDDKKL